MPKNPEVILDSGLLFTPAVSGNPGTPACARGTPRALSLSQGGHPMETILIIVVVVLLLGGGGFYWRGRR